MNTKPTPPDLTEDDKLTYRAIMDAAKAGRLGIISCLEKGTGKPILVLTAKNLHPDGSLESLVPLASVFTSCPDFIEPPEGFSLHSDEDEDDLSTQQHSE